MRENPGRLLAANIQALVRSLSTIAPDLQALASQINRHLFRYTPGSRFATAAFIVLDRDSGELVYVNAGHILRSCGTRDTRIPSRPQGRPCAGSTTRPTTRGG